eukprot:m.336521 g.336521  ORF g.336521 m.336521 type:complete len:468 (+) comp17879_c0_seq1:84-1487(+)
MFLKLFQDAISHVNLMHLSIGWKSFMFVVDDLWLSLRNRNAVKNCTKPPPELEGTMTQETLEKARSYNLDRSAFGLVYGCWQQVTGTAMLLYGFMPFMWRIAGEYSPLSGNTAQAITFLVFSTIIEVFLETPWSLYSTFVVEEKHGFNKQTLGFFIKDQIKKLALNVVLTSVIMSLLLAVIDWAGENFFIYCTLLVVGISVFMFAVYHDYIAPLFDTFVPLPEGNLRTKIEELAASLKFPLRKLEVVRGSVRSSHSNAYFYGFGKNKRIVLFDTLLLPTDRPSFPEVEKDEEKTANASTEEEDSKKDSTEDTKGCNVDEVLSVLSHEMGHWHHNHVLKGFIRGQVNIMFMFFILEQLSETPQLLTDFGFAPGENAKFLFLMIVFSHILSPLNTVIGIAQTYLTRVYEFQADEFAKNLGKAAALQRALIKLNQDNLGFPVSDPIYSAVHHSHPTLLQRIRALKDKKEE